MRDSQISGSSQTTSAVTALLAAWLIVSPWLLGIPSGTLATPPIDFALDIVVIGSLLLAASAMRINLAKTVPFNWLEVILGVWLILSPWMFGYGSGDVQTWNCVAVGAVVAALATLSLASSAFRHAETPEHVNH